MTVDPTHEDADADAEDRPGAASPARSEELEAVKADLDALIQTHPIGTLAAALGVGYALGGGLFTPLTLRVLRLSVRLGLQFAVLPVLERELGTLAGVARPGGAGVESAGDAPQHH